MIVMQMILVMISLRTERKNNRFSPSLRSHGTLKANNWLRTHVMCERDQENERRCKLPIGDITACESERY
jgi:hypothetical protein